ncbi:MAG: hypothetical protein JNM17_22555, partial [Archangium sp.]|nr:hypothetical protein [Archangium sp.]
MSTLDRPLVDEPLEESLGLVQLAGHEAPTAIWVHRRDAGASKELLLARFDVDAGWQPVERLDEAPLLEQAEVGVYRFGQITAKWVKASGSFADVQMFARRSNGSGWFDAELLSPPSPILGNSILRVGTDGLAVVSW